MMRILWEVDGSSGCIVVTRREYINEIARLRKAGYVVTGLERIA